MCVPHRWKGQRCEGLDHLYWPGVALISHGNLGLTGTHHVVSDFNRLFVLKRDFHPSLKYETDPLSCLFYANWIRIRVLEGLDQVQQQMIFRFPSVFTRTEVKPFYHVLRLSFNKLLDNDALCFQCTKNFRFSFANAFTGNRRELANALVKTQRRARPFFRHRLVFNSQKIATVACIKLRVYNGTRSDEAKPPDRKAPMKLA